MHIEQPFLIPLGMLPLQKRCSNFNQDRLSTRLVRFGGAPVYVQIVSVSNAQSLKINHLRRPGFLRAPVCVQIVTLSTIHNRRFLSVKVWITF